MVVVVRVRCIRALDQVKVTIIVCQQEQLQEADGKGLLDIHTEMLHIIQDVVCNFVLMVHLIKNPDA